MKLDIIFIPLLMANILFTVMFPSQVLGDDPLGFNGIEQTKVQDYITQEGKGFIQGYDSKTGQIITSNGIFDSLEEVTNIANQQESGVVSNVLGLSFIDYITVGINAIKSAFMFVIGILFVLWQMPYPLNLLFAMPLSMLYMYGLVSYIIGR